MNKSLVALLATIAIFSMLQQSACAGVDTYHGLKPKHKEETYEKYVLVSGDGKRTMTGEELESKFLCKEGMKTASELMPFLRAFPPIDAGKMDESMSYTSFHGKQAGNDVIVSLLNVKQNGVTYVAYIWINNQTVAYCW